MGRWVLPRRLDCNTHNGDAVRTGVVAECVMERHDLALLSGDRGILRRNIILECGELIKALTERQCNAICQIGTIV